MRSTWNELKIGEDGRGVQASFATAPSTFAASGSTCTRVASPASVFWGCGAVFYGSAGHRLYHEAAGKALGGTGMTCGREFHNSGHWYGAALIYALAGFPAARFATWLSRCCRSPRGTTQTPERWGMVLNFSGGAKTSYEPDISAGFRRDRYRARRGVKARSCTCPTAHTKDIC